MSMWEIEGLGELAVNWIAGRTHLSPAERRTYYAAVYGLQSAYDCSYTHFRCHGPLLRDGFLQRIDLEQHPAYATQRDAIDAAVASGEGWLPMDPGAPRGPVAGLYCQGPSPKENPQPGIYFDITEPLWEVARAAGHVDDLGDPPYEAWDDQSALLRIMTLAAEGMQGAADPQGREAARHVLKGFYGFAAMHCAWQCERPSPENPMLQALFASPALKAALTGPTLDWIDERFPVPSLPRPDESSIFDPAMVAFWRTPLDA